jgi:hypothetical protein
MIIECQKSSGYLGYVRPGEFLLTTLQEVIKTISEDEREYWNNIVLKIESIKE